MAGTFSVVGSGYHMSEDDYLRKIEKTCIFEDPHQVKDYHLQQLKNLRCDKPFFESDAPRYNNLSQDRLNIRHGGRRTLTEPFLPDGTFLGHTEKDIRGIVLEPNMRKHRDQQFSRSKFIKFYDDSHMHIPESGVHPTNMQMKKKGAFYQVKDRLKIFDTSKIGMHNGGTNNNILTSTAVCLQKTDAKSPEMADEMCYNTARMVTDLSNDTSIGWRRTTDHKFKVAKYNQKRLKLGTNEQDWAKNRSNTSLEHDVLVPYQDQNIPKSLVLKMDDIVKQRELDMKAGKTINFKDSTTPALRARRITVDDLNTKRSTVQTSPEDPHYLLPSSQAPHMSGKSCIPVYDAEIADKIIMNTTIFDHITSVNKNMTRKQKDDLRNSIIQSSKNPILLLDQYNKNRTNKNITNRALWESEPVHHKTKAFKFVKFKNNNKNVPAGQNINIDNVNYEKYKLSSKEWEHRHSNSNIPQIYEPDVLYDTSYGVEVEGERHTGPMKGKFTRDLMDREYNKFDNNNLKEILATNA